MVLSAGSGLAQSADMFYRASMAVYERFKAWEVCHQLSLAVYQATRSWPREELFGLTAQARRAAHSAAANIAEGSAKKGGMQR